MPKPSDVIAQQRDRIVRFRDSLQRLVEALERDDANDDLFDEVSVAAGEARRSYAENDGRTFAVQEGIYLVSNADPMSHWMSAFDADSDLTMAKVVASLNLAIGRAQERCEAAKQSERGLVGLIASILRWPAVLRSAVGPSRGQQRAAQTLGVAGQVIVGAIAAALGALIIQGAVVGWQLLFGP